MKMQSLKVLEDSRLPPAQAQAILKAMEIELVESQSNLATKPDLEAKLAGVEARLTRWVFTCVLAQTAVLSGVGYFLLEHLRR